MLLQISTFISNLTFYLYIFQTERCYGIKALVPTLACHIIIIALTGYHCAVVAAKVKGRHINGKATLFALLFQQSSYA